jgi:hypothetical protein
MKAARQHGRRVRRMAPTGADGGAHVCPDGHNRRCPTIVTREWDDEAWALRSRLRKAGWWN